MTRPRSNIASRFVVATVARYGAAGALARARRLVREYPATRVPQWLTRAIELLQLETTKGTRR
jgi:hypothetical protein